MFYDISDDKILSIKKLRDPVSQNYIANINYMICGKKFQATVCAEKRKLLGAEMQKFIDEIFITKSVLLSPSITYDALIRNWLDNVKRHQVKKNTLNRITSYYNLHIKPYLGNMTIDKITLQDVQKTINIADKQGLNRETIRGFLCLINSSFRYYRVVSGKYTNPCEGVVLPRKTKVRNATEKFFDSEKRKKFENVAFATDDNGELIYRYGPALVFMMYTGMRVCEAGALTWQDIDFKEKLIDINKSYISERGNDGQYKLVTQYGSKTPCSLRTIPMTMKARWCLLELKHLAAGSKYVITRPDGNQVSKGALYLCLNKILQENNIVKEGERYGTHALRHTFATMLFENGCNSKIVSELLGHSSAKFTENTYIHVINKQKVTAMKDFDKYIF